MSCNIGLHKAITQVLNNKPWFKYKKGDTYIEILESPGGKINQDNAIGVARTLSNELNKMINNGYKKVGVVFYPRFLGEKRVVSIDASSRQLDLINATDAAEVAEIQKEVLENEQMLAEGQFDLLTEQEIAENKEFLASEPFIGIGKNLPPGDFGQLKLFGEANVVDNKDTAIKQKYFPNSNINTSTDILQKIALSDHPLAMVAAQFLQFDPKVSIELVEGENIGSFVDDLGISRISAARYSNNKISIAKDANFKGLGSEPTLLHEILHAMTNKYISKNPNSSEVKALKKVYEHALTLKTKMPRNVYSFTNLDEFIVAVFTDASTIKFLLEQPSISKSEPNFFFDIFKAIINLFKLDTSNTTLYNDAFIAATNIVIAQDAANKRNAEETFFIADDGTLFNIAAQGAVSPELANQINFSLKAINSLSSPEAEKLFKSLAKNNVTGDAFWSKIQKDLNIPKNQIELMKGLNLENPTREDLITSLLANYTYTVEINTTKTNINTGNVDVLELDHIYVPSLYETFYFSYRDGWFKEDRQQNRIIATEQELKEIEEYKNKNATENSSFYINLTVPGGADYTENEIATPGIIPNIKGHAQFATKNGIGWFRSDDKLPEYAPSNETASKFSNLGIDDLWYEQQDAIENYPTKTRRILEVQSDLFQKGRDKENLVLKEQSKYNAISESGEEINPLLNNDELEDFDANEFAYKLPTDKTIGTRDFGYGEVREDEDNFYFESGNGKYSKISKEKYEQEKVKLSKLDNAQLQETRNKAKQLKENQFLQLLNKDNNWVNFFVKSIIQDSAKKGYEKVLFPKGDTAAKVEGHTTLEEFKKQKENRIKELKAKKAKQNATWVVSELFDTFGSNDVEFTSKEEAEKYANENSTNTRVLTATRLKSEQESINNEINQLKQELERVEEEGFGALRPIYKFYEETVTNILKKQGYNPTVITDEYGNQWNEVEIMPSRDLQGIVLNLQTTTTPSYQTTATPETIAALKNLLERLGIPVETSETILEQFGANGLADGIRQVIQIANGKEDVALTEETMHMLTMMVPEAVLNELLDQITDYKMYANVYEQYKEHPAYQNPDGSPNVQMIKLEAAGKILAEYFIMNAEGLSKEEVNIAKTLWAKIKDWIKNVFGVNKDAFQDFINKIDSTEYRLFGMNSRAQNLLNIAFGKEEIAGFADTLSSGLAANSYAKAKEDFKHNIKSKDPLVQQLMNLEDLILNIKELDLPFVQKMKEYVHLPNKRAFATGKYKLEKATEEIDETQDFLEQLKERTTQALEYFRNTYATTSSLLDRVTVIQNMLRDDVDLLSPEEVKPKLTDLQRVRLYHELSIAKDIANNYKQQMQDLEALFKDLKPGVNDYGINDLIDKTKSLASKIESIEGVYSIENLEKTIEKFVAPQIEGYKKQKNKEVLRIQEQLNTLNNEIAKKGTSKSRLASKKRLEDLLAKTEHDLEYPPISAKAIIDILENNSNKKNNFFGITPIDMLMEAGRTNKNQAILAVSTILSDALLESQRAAEADILDIKNLFDKYNRKQNLTGTAYDDITDQVVRYRFDEQSGELKERNENVLINEVKQWQFENDLEVLRYLEYQATVNSGDNEFLEKQYAKYLGQELTPEEKTDLAGTFKKKYNDLMNIYGKRKYIDQYYEIQSILDNAVLSDGRTVREYRQQYIDAIKIADEELNNVLNTGIGEDVALSSKQEALRELQKLESLFDYNTGLKKKGDALVVAETILKWKKAKKNVEVAPGVFADIDKYYSTYYSEFRWKEEKDEYEKAIEDAKKVYEESPSAINQEALRIAEASYERWRKRNVIKRPPPEYYKEKARIIQAIQTILDGVKQYANAEQQYKLEVDEAWDIIRSATAGNRDEDGVIEGGKSQNIAEEVKKAEETLSELKTIIKQFRSRFTEEELFQLDKLNRQLDEMQETTTTSYWDDLLQAKVDIKKKQMVANGIADPSFDQIMSELIEEDFFQKNMINVDSKYRSTDTEDLPQDVIRFISMINGKKIVRTFRPTYIWRDVLTKGKYEKQDKMAYSLMRYDVDERFINPNYETMYGTVSLDPSKVTADPIAKNRYFDEKFANLNSTQRDFLDQYREMYYKDQMFSPVNQRLGDTLPRITMAGVQRTAKIFNPLTMPSRLYKFFSKGLETSEMEAEYGEGALDENGLPVNGLPANAVAEFLKRKFSKQKPDTTEGRKGTKRINVKIFAKYVNKDMNISIPEKDLFRLLTMYNIERHRVESLKNYTPALNKALELSADKKIFKSLYTQVQFFLNKRTKAKEFGKLSKYVLDPVSDFARRSKGFLLLGTFLRLGSIFKNTIAGQFAIWVNKSRLKQYSQESYITATMKAVKGSALMVLQRFSSTPSKYVAMVRRLNVAVNFDINDATSNNREILLKTANGLGYGLGALRDGSEKQLELTMFELYRAANKIMIDGMAYDVEDCYEYKNGILTPKMIPSKNEDGSIKLDAEGNPVMVPMITPEQENDFTKNVMEMVSYTQGNFASDNMSMAKLYFLGRTLLFMKNFIYNPLMVRVGEKRVTATGHEIEGYYRILGSMIGTAFNNPENFEDFLRKAKDIKGVPGRFATVMKTRSPQEKNALNLFFKDFAMVSGIGAVLYFLEKGLKEGDTDDDSQLWWYMAFLKKVFAEISFYNIVDIVGTLIKIMVSDKEEVENARSNDPIDKAAWYFVGNPSINLAFSAFFPLQHNTFNLSPENVTDPFYSQYKDNVLLYNFMVQLGTKPDLFYGKRALSSYEHFNKSLTDYETESEKKRGKSRSGGRSRGGGRRR